MNIILTLPVASSGTVAAWTITAVLTLILIGLPVFYLLALTLSVDEEAFERAVRDQVRYVELKARADAYAYGKDIYGVLATPPELSHTIAAAPTPAPAEAASSARHKPCPGRGREHGDGGRRAAGRKVGQARRG